jgi:hypothetical protein
VIIFQGVHGGHVKTGKLDGTLKFWVSTVDTLSALNVTINNNVEKQIWLEKLNIISAQQMQS